MFSPAQIDASDSPPAMRSQIEAASSGVYLVGWPGRALRVADFWVVRALPTVPSDLPRFLLDARQNLVNAARLIGLHHGLEVLGDAFLVEPA